MAFPIGPNALAFDDPDLLAFHSAFKAAFNSAFDAARLRQHFQFLHRPNRHRLPNILGQGLYIHHLRMPQKVKPYIQAAVQLNLASSNLATTCMAR